MSDQTIFPLMLIRVAGLPVTQLSLPDEDFRLAAECLSAALKRQDRALIALSALENAREQDTNDPVQKAVMNTRRKYRDMLRGGHLKALRIPATTDLARHPVFDLVSDWNAAFEDSETAQKQLENAYENLISGYYAHVRMLAAQGPIPASLLFTSHDLLKNIHAFVLKSTAAFNKTDRKTALGLWQYISRAAAKTSPLSRFTTVSLFRTDQAQDEWFFPEIKSAVTPNVALLPLFYEILLEEPAFYQALSLRLNPCVTEIRSPLEWLYYDGTQESFQRIEPDAVLQLVLRCFLERKTPLSFSDLQTVLADAVDAAPEALDAYIRELLDLGLLEWRLPETGTTASWCGNLYQFLGFLQGTPLIVETAALLLWLRTAARALPHQPVEEALATQEAAWNAVAGFLRAHGREAPPIGPARLFFEDAEQSVACKVPADELTRLAAELRDLWSRQKNVPMPRAKTQLAAFADSFIPHGQTAPVVDFLKAFLTEKPALEHDLPLREMPAFKGKIGALIQVFEENGACKAVVNALFPGGGKLTARWLHLFPSSVREKLENWANYVPFPWHDWNNANFQPLRFNLGVSVPENRLNHLQELPLGEILVKNSPEGPVLWHPHHGTLPPFSDLGLEAPDQKTPARRAFWHLTVPHVSLTALLPKQSPELPSIPGCRRFSRVVSGSLVLARARWELEPALWADWVTLPDADFFYKMPQILEQTGVPRYFFARTGQERPQYFDCRNPLSMKQLQLILAAQPAKLLISEMLPLPEQAVVDSDGPRAAEFVIEVDCSP